ncbi:MAG: A-macroglobulin complement component, partial [Planctomycetaceae bacterium]|nr:A-macroglobulin complement component [Planctomycetaceae bacterium]
RTPAKKPADIAGVILNKQGETVGKFRSEHEGRGRFVFTPNSESKYSLKIIEPSGIKTTFPLPEVKATGAVITATKSRYKAGEPVRLQVASSSSRAVKVTLSQREVEVASTTMDIAESQLTDVVLTPPKDVDGVLIATLWDEQGKPLAERLVFRQPKESVNVDVIFDEKSYTPGSAAKLTVRTTDADGKPVAAVVGLTVTDDSVLELIEKREQAPRLPVMVLLENDVRELADAHVYLDPHNPKAPLAVDLLLGTQGWRRFAFVETTKFLAAHGDTARRVLALKMQTRRDFGQLLGAARGRGVRFNDRFGGAPAPPQGAAERDDKPRAAAAPQADGVPKDAAAPPKKRPAAPANRPVVVAAAREAELADQERPAEAAAKQQLRQALVKADLAKKAELGAFADKPLGNRRRMKSIAMVMVREYAHQVRKNRQPNDRVDFTETLYWNAGVKTDAKTGEATVTFGMSDAVTSFRVLADAFGANGSVGGGTTVVDSIEPFYVEPKLPLEVTSGDVIELPLGIVNSTPDMLSQTTLVAVAKGLSIAETTPFDLPGEARVRRLMNIAVGNISGETNFTLKATAGPYSDAVTRTLNVVPLGFPIEIARGGMLNADETRTHEVTIPAQIVPGSITTEVRVYPSPMAGMTEALKALIREPYGCFEQTSSSTYPLVMAQQYFQSHIGVDPALIERSNTMLEKGYKRLIGYECKQGGFEWFGADPGHEALTAYGLMEFSDMAEVRDVDTEMISRSREWLLGQRDGKGGFKRERRALHTWLADPDVSNAYITWALLSAGETGLDREVAALKETAKQSQNSYVLALAANVMMLAEETEAATELRDRLVQLQNNEGVVDGATKSIVGSGGQALAIETTALAALAWLGDSEYIDFTDKAIRYLAESCKGGRYGSTQSTVLALKAIIANDKAMAHPKSPGRVQLVVDGRLFGTPVKFDRKTQGTIELPDMSRILTPGKHTIAVKMFDGSSMPHTVTIRLFSTRPDSSADCKVALEVLLADEQIAEGEVTEAQVKVENKTEEAIPTPIAIIGIPGGLEVRHDQLKELVKSKQVAAYEVRGREVILYWRDMAAGEQREFPLSLVAAIPGSYSGPPSRAYLYYTDEHKQWSDPLHVEISAK